MGMSSRYEVRLAGAGGQGLILAGLILAEAAGLHDGKHVVQTQSYAPLARGAPSRSEVIISDEEIDYPKVTVADALVALNQEACDRYAREVRRNGMLIVDSSLVERAPAANTYRIPITEIAREATGREITASVVALGVLGELTGAVSREALSKAVRARAPKGTAEINLKALEAGYAAAAEWKRREGTG